jgi:hypothetical protein
MWISMVCPRCHNEIADDADSCPDCFLPKPRAECAKEQKEQVEQRWFDRIAEIERQRQERLAKALANSRKSKQRKRRIQPHPRHSQRKVRPIAVAMITVVTAVLGFGGYFVVSSYLNPAERSQAEVKRALDALSLLRHLPSSQAGMSVEERMAEELDKSRRAGLLVRYQGWLIRPIKGTRTKVLLIFSFEEKGNKEQRAEWVADLEENTFVPQNELAAAVYKK